MDTLSILHILDHNSRNALTDYALTLSRLLRSRGHDVCVASVRGCVGERDFARDGLRHVPLGGGGFSLPKDLRTLADLFRGRVDVVNSFGPWAQNLSIGALMLTGKRVPLVRTRIFIHSLRGSFLQRFLYRKFVSLLVVTNTSSARISSQRLNLSDGRVACLYGGVDTQRFTPDHPSSLRGRLGLPEEVCMVALIARLSHIKGHEFFIRAVSAARRDNPRITGIIAGPEDCLPVRELEDLARVLNVSDGIRFLGYVGDVRDLIAGADVGVISSIGSEEHSRIGLEYMAMGKPVIGTRVGVIPDIIADGVNGYVVEPKDPSALAKKMVALSGRKDTMREMGCRGREMAEERFSFHAFSLRAEELYRGVAGMMEGGA